MKGIHSTVNIHFLEALPRYVEEVDMTDMFEKKLLELVHNGRAVWKHHFVLAVIYKSREEDEKAVPHFRIAYETGPEDHRLMRLYSVCLYAYKNYEECKDEHISIRERTWVLYGLRLPVDLYEKEGDAASIMRVYQRSVLDNPRDNHRYGRMIEYGRQHGKLKEVVSYLEKVAANYPGLEQPQGALEKARKMLGS